MHANMENVDPMRSFALPVECGESLSLNSLVPPNNWDAFRVNPFSNQSMSRHMNNFGSQFLPPMEIGCRCEPPADQRFFQQPYSNPISQFNYWDAYWKNYWKSYYQQYEGPQPSFRMPNGYESRYEREPWSEYQEQEESDEYQTEDVPEARPKPRPRFEQRSRRDRRQEQETGEEHRSERERPRMPGGDRDGNIASIAKGLVGQALFNFIPGTPGRLGCAASVSASLNKAGFGYARHAGVHGLTQQLQRNGWTRQEGIQSAQPGDVVVVVRRSGWENGGGGSHIGIVGEGGKVYHNSSGRQQWIEDSLQRAFGGGIQRFILRPPRS